MRTVVFLVTIFISSFYAYAQVSIGPLVGMGLQGPNSYRFSESQRIDELDRNLTLKDPGRKPIPGLSYKIGVITNVDISKYFAISGTFAYQSLSSKTEYSEKYEQIQINDTQKKYFLFEDTKRNELVLNYFTVPVLFQVKYPISQKITLGFGVGPEFSYLFGGRQTESTIFSWGGAVTTKISKVVPKNKNELNSNDLMVNNDLDESNNVTYVKPLNVSINYAPFVQLQLNGMNLLISPTFYMGITNIMPSEKEIKEVDYFKEIVPGYLSSDSYSVTYIKQNKVKTGGFGLNVALLFGKSKP